MIKHDLPILDYHAHPAIGSTTAKLMLKSPTLFHDAITGDYTVKDTPAFVAGRLLHMAVLEPARFAALTTCTGPINQKTGQPFGRDTKTFQDWQAANPSLTFVDEWIPRSIDRMPVEVREILSHGVAETSIIRDSGLGFEVKARPDWWVGARCIYDLKSCKDIGQAKRDIYNHGYWFSSAWYRAWAKAETGQEQEFAWIFAEKHAPFRWRILYPDDAYCQHADEAVERVLQDLANRYASGDWSDPDEIETTVSPPDWLADETIEINEEGGINL